MTPLLDVVAANEKTAALLRNPLTRGVIRAATRFSLRPLAKARAKKFDVQISKQRLNRIPVKLARPKAVADNEKRLLINFHGGGFVVDSGSLTESIPLAGLTGIPVVSVMYRMAPEHPYPAAVEDALSVYRAALEEREASAIGIFGTSAGAVLTMQLLARINAEGLPMPAAAGVFSGSADLDRPGDCEGFLPPMFEGRKAPDMLADYTVGTDRTDPLLSPIYGDLSAFPPTLLMTSTRDQLLSQTVLADLALRSAGVETDLRVYEGMLHAFWAWIDCPESDDALAAQAAFFEQRLAA